ncbi:MAG TPA: phosphoribosylanthranilate isomerase [Methanomicrobiales archaeon]|nr:phosphoribosylanthranilate isomerase [Methanomicrobiales archaeon]
MRVKISGPVPLPGNHRETRVRVKICGITRAEDAIHAEKAGADAIGVILFSDSPRCISLETAGEIFRSVGPFITTVAVTHTKTRKDLEEIITLHPGAVQISHPFTFPAPPPVRVLRVVKPGDPLPGDADALVVDQSMGTGRHYDPGFAREMVRRSRVPVTLAGGLTPGNVADAIRAIRPYAVDVASGVEISPGIKDPARVTAFIRAAQGVLP